jgi:hypothetical protein
VLPNDELLPFVRAFAERVAAMPAQAVKLAKEAVDCGLRAVEPGLLAEGDRFNESLTDPEARYRMKRFLELGGQTREVELSLGKVTQRLGERS